MKTILPIVAQYFSDVGVKHGILEFIEQQDDSAGGLFANIKYELEPHELELQKLTSLGSDNTNVNVDPKHSVFSLFKELIPLLELTKYFDRVDQEQKVIKYMQSDQSVITIRPLHNFI
ncbi:unnamed protein product [Rotaria magnacalcarata]|uniref:Uncharacterized protein n=1 Tax=Rotaria magnacalcarata TaxID=392030 RepID=A0A819Z147_9BILA|nr:unnamed protein product [Rotaria magnacalcarata]